MATTMKPPTAREAEEAYRASIDQHPRVAAALRDQQRKVAEFHEMTAMTDRVRTARKSGSHGDVVAALATAPTDGELARAEAAAIVATKATDEARAAAREERERLFREYARGEIARLIADWSRLLNRNAEFERIAGIRHEAISGSSLVFVDGNPAMPRLRLMFEAYREGVGREYGVEIDD